MTDKKVNKKNVNVNKVKQSKISGKVTMKEKDIKNSSNTSKPEIAKVIKKDDSKANTKIKKEGKNIFKAIGDYFKSIFSEMKKVHWPNKKAMVKYSISTIVMVIFFGIIFYLVDLIIAGLKMVI